VLLLLLCCGVLWCVAAAAAAAAAAKRRLRIPRVKSLRHLPNFAVLDVTTRRKCSIKYIGAPVVDVSGRCSA
jgi:hypothetical protein